MQINITYESLFEHPVAIEFKEKTYWLSIRDAIDMRRQLEFALDKAFRHECANEKTGS